MLKVLKNKQAAYADLGIETAINEDENESVVALALVTPIMRRAHKMEFSQDIVFVDSSGSCDQANTVVTFMFGVSKIGGIPLGCVLHTSQSKENYTLAFRLLKNLIGSDGFYGKGFPSIIMSDDSTAERKALAEVFPHTSLLLCIFHVMQAVWRWLWDTNNKIQKDDKKYLMHLFRNVLFAPNESDCQNIMNTLQNDNVAKKYSKYLNYIQNLWNRKTDWCLCFRSKLTTRGHNTNNYVESSIRIFKDVVLQRCRAFNMCALLDFVASVLENYHKLRLINFSNRRDTKYDLIYIRFAKAAKHLLVKKISDNEFLVQSSKDGNEFYKVFTDINMCECIAGQGGAFCKHLCAVHERHENIITAPNLSTKDRIELAKIALGDIKAKDEGFFAEMIEMTTSINNNSNINSNHVSENTNNFQSEIEMETADTAIENDNQLEEDYKLEVENFRQNISRVIEIADKDKRTILPLLRKANSKLGNIRTPSQFASYLVDINKSAFQRRQNIGVQPGSISRRKKRAGLTSGACRIQAGRPSIFECAKVKKRKRKLGLSVSLNIANAKPH